MATSATPTTTLASASSSSSSSASSSSSVSMASSNNITSISISAADSSTSSKTDPTSMIHNNGSGVVSAGNADSSHATLHTLAAPSPSPSLSSPSPSPVSQSPSPSSPPLSPASTVSSSATTVITSTTPSSLSTSSSASSLSSASTSSTTADGTSLDTARLAALVSEELAKEAAYKEAKDKTIELSNSLLSLYEQTVKKLHALRSLERNLSVNAGQLLKSLQTEETVIQSLSSSMKRIKGSRKTLLSHITNPRWEVRHHYHMTAMEHNLSHRQPHVMDVAELLPGHLRLYAYARCGALMKRMLTWALGRAKNERNNANEQIKEVYRQLRETRADLKALGKIIDTIRAKSKHLVSDREADGGHGGHGGKQAQMEAMMRQRNQRLGLRSGGGMGMGGPGAAANASIASSGSQSVLAASSSSALSSSSSSTSSSSSASTMMSIRMRYFKSLNLAPKSFVDSSSETSRQYAAQDAKQRAETYNSDWKNIANLISNLEAQKKESSKAEQELKLIQNMRKRIGLDSLPSPLKFTESKHAASTVTTAPNAGTDHTLPPQSLSPFTQSPESTPFTNANFVDPINLSPAIGPSVANSHAHEVQAINLNPSSHSRGSPAPNTPSSSSSSAAASSSSTKISLINSLLNEKERESKSPTDEDDEDDDDDDELLDRLQRAQIAAAEDLGNQTDDSDTEGYERTRRRAGTPTRAR